MAKPGLFKRLSLSLTRTLGLDETDEKGKKVKHYDSWEEATDGLTLSMTDVLEERSGDFSDTLRVVSLVALREASGSEWVRLHDRIHMLTSSLIERGLGKDGVYGQEGDDIFILCFNKSVPGAEATRRAQEITTEVGRRLIGEKFKDVAGSLAHMAEMHRDDVYDEGGFNAEAVSQAIEEVRDKEAEELGFKRVYDFADEQKEDGAILHETERRTKGPQTKFHETQVEHQDPWHTGRAFLDEHGNPLPPEQHPVPEVEHDPDLPKLSWEERANVRFQPVWRDEASAVDTYLAKPFLFNETGHAPQPFEQALAKADPDESLPADVAVVEKAVATFSEGEKNKVGMVIPVRFSALASHRRAQIVEALSAIPVDVRQTYLDLELTVLPLDVQQGDLARLVAAIAPECRAVRARVPLGFHGLSIFVGTGVKSIGVDLNNLVGDTRKPVVMTKAVREFTSACDAERPVLAPHIWGLKSRGEVAMAAKLGAALLGGPAIMKDQPKPGPRMPVTRAKLIPK